MNIDEVFFRFGHEVTLSLIDSRISDLSLLVEGIGWHQFLQYGNRSTDLLIRCLQLHTRIGMLT